MQDLALAEGALPKHLHTALYTVTTQDNRLLTNRYVIQKNQIIRTADFKHQPYKDCHEKDPLKLKH